MREETDHRGELSETFRLLASQRRLYAISCLREARTPMDVRELAVAVAARECGGTPGEPPEQVIERVHQSLYHTHLPKLRAASVVEYDDHRDAVALADGSEELDSVVAAVFDESSTHD